MNERLRILLIDDDEDDYFLLKELVPKQTKGRNFHHYDLDWISNYEEARQEILSCRYDLYLVDYRLGAHSGLDLLSEAAAQKCPVPFILLTGQGDYQVDLAAMELGAADYLEKGQLTQPLLERSIRYAVDRARNLADLQKQAREIDTLRKATSSLLNTLDLSRLMGQILDEAREAIPAADHSWLHLMHLSNGPFQHLQEVSFSDPRIQKISSLNSSDGSLAVLSAGRPLLIADIQEDPSLLSLLENLRNGSAVHSAIIVPLAIVHEVFGTISVAAAKPAAFTTDNLELLTSFAATASAALHNAVLYAETQNLAAYDPLTGKLNRRTLFQYGQREIERFRRFGHRLSALMFDVDHFKAINDTYGHSVGDEVLVRIADICSKLIRNVDLLGRYGGDEFAIVLPEAGLPTAREIADRIRTTVYKKPIDTHAGPISVSISIGVAQANPDISDFGRLLHKADQALYRSKQAGRNRTSVAQELH